jgi:hypothetical protein
VTARHNQDLSEDDDIVRALTGLQQLVRRPWAEGETRYASTFVVESEEGSDPISINLLADEVRATNAVVALLGADLRFEHLFDPKAQVRSFIADCVRNRDADQVAGFIAEHARPPVEDVCFIPVTGLIVKKETVVGAVRLLPREAAELPITPHERIQAVVAVPVVGTKEEAMVDRARAEAGAGLRRLRIALRADRWIHDAQLRFRLDSAFMLASGASGWVAPEDVSWDLELDDALIQKAATEPVSLVPTTPETDLDHHVDLALGWIEAAYFAPDPVVAALNLCFALEAVLGRKSDREKGRGLALRRAVLSRVVRRRFAHPNRIYLLYDQLRSSAVHGEIPPSIDRASVSRFAWDVREAVNEALSFSRSKGIVTRRRLLMELAKRDEWTEMTSWLRDNADSGWSTYLDESSPGS